MERPQAKVKNLNFFKGLTIIYAVGLMGHLIQPVKPLMLAMTPWVILISGSIVLYPVVREKNWRTISWLLAVGLITFFLEVAGVATGKIFGHYAYSDVLGRKVFGVPLLIGFNWMLVLFGSVNLAQMVSRRILPAIFIAVICPPVFDYVLEPVAIALNYWQWQAGTPPVQNYLTWAVISFVLCGIYLMCSCSSRSKLPAFYLGLQFFYFAVLNILA